MKTTKTGDLYNVNIKEEEEEVEQEKSAVGMALMKPYVFSLTLYSFYIHTFTAVCTTSPLWNISISYSVITCY